MNFSRYLVSGSMLIALATAPSLALAATVKVAEGTEVSIRFDEKLSSATSIEGDQFSVSLNEELELPGGVIIKPGYKGRGEVTSAQKKGFMGKAGELNVRLNYIRIGDNKLYLRASKGTEGKGAVGATIALTVLFGPLGLLKSGHDIEIKPGQAINAFIDRDGEIDLPAPPPPNPE